MFAQIVWVPVEKRLGVRLADVKHQLRSTQISVQSRSWRSCVVMEKEEVSSPVGFLIIFFIFFADLLYLSLTCTRVLDSSGIKTNFLLNRSKWAHFLSGLTQVRCHLVCLCMYYWDGDWGG